MKSLMNRLVFTVSAFALLGNLGWAASSQPNIVLFLSDDHGVEFSGSYGHKSIRTPNIDAL